jgi:hypothetical protein
MGVLSIVDAHVFWKGGAWAMWMVSEPAFLGGPWRATALPLGLVIIVVEFITAHYSARRYI